MRRAGKLDFRAPRRHAVRTDTDFWVGDRLVRPSLGEIQLGPERVHLEPRSMEVLLALARRPGEVFPKQELIDAVWGEAFVSDEVLTHAIWDLRRAFGDQASDPEFIQTIPKRGYRLIAPVQDRAAKGGGLRARPIARLVLWGIAAAAILLMIGVQVARRDSESAHVPARDPAGALLLQPTDAPPELADKARTLNQILRNRLTGIQGVDLHLEAECRSVDDGGTTWCLRPILISMTDSFQASGVFREVASPTPRYATPTRTLAGRGDLEPFARELAEMTAAFLEVIGNERFRDPDLTPWLSLQGRDIRAIRDFLHGVGYVYRDEAGGGRSPMDRAIALDPGFIAPRVWRTPAILAEGDAEAKAAHRRDLEKVYAHGSAFEKAMVQWAIALIQQDRVAQIRELNSALRENPENRPARLNLGFTHLARQEYDLASAAFEELVNRGWDFPPLYPLAALAALHRDDLAFARRSLDRARLFDPIDPHSLALMRLLAIYDGKIQEERRLGEEFRRRAQDIGPEEIDSEELAFAAKYLAARAESEGKPQVATRLRESAD